MLELNDYLYFRSVYTKLFVQVTAAKGRISAKD
jgi:hypothetical protein